MRDAKKLFLLGGQGGPRRGRPLWKRLEKSKRTQQKLVGGKWAERQNVSGLIRHDSRHGGKTPTSVEISMRPSPGGSTQACRVFAAAASVTKRFGAKVHLAFENNKQALSKHRFSWLPSQQHFMQQERLLRAAMCLRVGLLTLYVNLLHHLPFMETAAPSGTVERRTRSSDIVLGKTMRVTVGVFMSAAIQSGATVLQMLQLIVSARRYFVLAAAEWVLAGCGSLLSESLSSTPFPLKSLASLSYYEDKNVQRAK